MMRIKRGKYTTIIIFEIILIKVFLITGVRCLSIFDIFNPYRTELLPSCNIERLNMTVSDSDLDGLNLFLVQFIRYRSYSISEAARLLADPMFDPSKKTVIFAHGFIRGPLHITSMTIAWGYLLYGDYNVILLDSRRLIDFSYLGSAAAVPSIGRYLGEKLHVLSQNGFNISSLTLVGHSLGAHIVGNAGKSYFKASGKKLPFIVGLDPAGPCFKPTSSNYKLNKEDANFVQVIHTNGGFFGIMAALGHVDLYINGGRIQPKLMYTPLSILLVNHDRCLLLWSLALFFQTKFVGYRCENVEAVDRKECSTNASDTVYMGHLCDKKAEGLYNVPTTAIFPYFYI